MFFDFRKRGAGTCSMLEKGGGGRTFIGTKNPKNLAQASCKFCSLRKLLAF